MGGGADDQQIGTMSPRKIDQDGGLVLAFRGQRMNRHVEAVTAAVAGDVGARLRAMALRACFGVDVEEIDLRAGLGELQRLAKLPLPLAGLLPSHRPKSEQRRGGEGFDSTDRIPAE